MKFRILESILDSFKQGTGTYFIYKNPTPQELRAKDESKGNRGIIDPEGNLYVEAKWEEDGEGVVYSGWIHSHLISVLHDNGLFKKFNLSNNWSTNPSDLHHGVCVQRDGNSLNFYLAESYEIDETAEVAEIVKKTLDLAKKKNPSLNFSEESIFNLTPEEERMW